MTVIDAATLGELWLDSPLLKTPRTPTHWTDWGDQETVGLHTKRSGKDFYSLDTAEDFGVFLGKHEIGYVVALKSPDCTAFTSGEVFETLDEMKAAWTLD